MVNKQVKRLHILEALIRIDKEGIPKNRMATKYNLYYNGKIYPPKYVLSIATEIATGKQLEPSQFGGGKETNSFLSGFDFTIREGSKSLNSQIKKTTLSKKINICTAIIRIPFDNWDEITNSEKFELLSDILKGISKNTDILILPAGFLNSNNKKPEIIFSKSEETITRLINEYNDKLLICFGIDGRNKLDQLALTINKTGIIAVARKFHHMDNSIYLADDAFAIENTKERHFLIKGKRPYLAVCYDIFGISKLKLDNKKNYDFIIGVIHGFGRNGGDSDFARKGLGGASKQWKIHSYASAVFSDNRNPTNWTSGVEWTHGDESVKNFTYDQIRLDSKLKTIETGIGTIYLRNYDE